MSPLLDLPAPLDGETPEFTDDSCEYLDGTNAQWISYSERLANGLFPDRDAVLRFLALGKTDEDLIREAGQKLMDDIFGPLGEERAKELAAEAVVEAERKAALWRAYIEPLPAPEGNPALADWRIENSHLLADPCTYCGGPAGTLDHIVPRHRGGANLPDNATAACQRCNSSKGRKPLLLWLATRRPLNART